MYSVITPDVLDDFVTLTLSNFKRRKWTDISMEFTEYVSANLIDKYKVRERGGKDIAFRLQYRNTGMARNTGMYAQNAMVVEDLMTSGTVPWTMQETGFGYDIYEDVFQSDRETIINELVIRDHSAMNDIAILNEENLWTAPTSSTNRRPMGIPFWLQKDASTTVEGDYNGGNPTGWSGGAAGIDSTTYTNWRNWTFGYTTASTNDLVRKVKKALVFTRFMPPHPHPELGYRKADYAVFTTYRVLEPLQRLAESRNDNLGADLARYMNEILIGGVPIRYVPYLEENDTDDPLYGVNFRYFTPYVKANASMRRNPPRISPHQRTVREVWIDNWMQYICTNRRTQWVGSLS